MEVEGRAYNLCKGRVHAFLPFSPICLRIQKNMKKRTENFNNTLIFIVAALIGDSLRKGLGYFQLKYVKRGELGGIVLSLWPI